MCGLPPRFFLVFGFDFDFGVEVVDARYILFFSLPAKLSSMCGK
jgi:hypothetical protein